MKEINEFEISFKKKIKKNEIVLQLANYFKLSPNAFITWEVEPKEKKSLHVRLSYSHLEISNSVLISLSFNNFLQVNDLFELDAALYFAKKLDCNTIVKDPSYDIFYLQVSPDGSIHCCNEDVQRKNYPSYKMSVSKQLTYEDIASHYNPNTSAVPI